MKFECFNGMRNCDYCGSCHSEFKARTSDEKRQAYNQALEDFITEIERQTTFYCGKDSHLRQILEQLKR